MSALHSLTARSRYRTRLSHAATLLLMILIMVAFSACGAITITDHSDGSDQNTTAESVSFTEEDAIHTQIVRVIDGDTVAVAPVANELSPTNDARDETTVRLISIQAPEMNFRSAEAPECMAEEATQRLKELLPVGEAVTLHFDPVAKSHDKYGRALMYLERDVDDADVAESLLSDGLVTAWYPTYEPEPSRFTQYHQIEESAAQQNLGLAQC